MWLLPLLLGAALVSKAGSELNPKVGPGLCPIVLGQVRDQDEVWIWSSGWFCYDRGCSRSKGKLRFGTDVGPKTSVLVMLV